MDRAELKVIYFSDTDVIATSGFLTLSQFGDGNLTNQKMTYNGKTVDCNSGAAAWNDIFSKASNNAQVYRFTDGSSSRTLNGAFAVAPKSDGNYLSLLNGTFKYDKDYTIGSKTGYFVKQDKQ